ncbi:hypothetical protein Btru_041966 [Bulinus truncatus]|nr:hypothetical protein Btru_041966 [Bulinus truncatus]
MHYGMGNSLKIICKQNLEYLAEVHEEKSWERDKFKEEAAQTFDLVLHKYNPMIRPPRAYIDIKVDISLNHIRHLDLLKQELQTVLDINLSWNDSRLQWTGSKVKQIIVNASIIWTPDIVIMNAVVPSRSLFPSTLKINQLGNVQWARKEEVSTFCMTEEKEVTQTCSISLGFLSNIKLDQYDRFFNESSTLSLWSNFTNHEWVVSDFNLEKRGLSVESKEYYTNLYINLWLDKKTRVGYKEEDTGAEHLNVSIASSTHGNSTRDSSGLMMAASVPTVLLLLCLSTFALFDETNYR